MSDSEGSTILLSPGSSADGIFKANEDDVFAWLRPHSDTAREAFNASVNSALKYRDKYEHIRQFLHVTERENGARSPFTEDDAEPGNKPPKWSGAFMLSLKARPRDPVKGWYLGTDRRRQPQEIDILLAPPTKTWASKRIASKHARLFFHEQSCRMMLEARHTVTITKNGAAVITQSRSQVIEDGELIEIGACSYIFEYTKLHSSPAFEQELVQLMKEHKGDQWSLNKLLSPSSVSIPISIGGYCCSPSAFAQGTYGRVWAGWTQDGSPVAIKVLKEPRETNIIGHKRLMDHIGYHPNIVQLRECVYHFDIEVPDAYCAYYPLAVASLSRLLGAYEFNLTTKLVLLVDYLQGLSFLHEKGIMHRDINPNNLAVTSFEDHTGLIIDLDSATMTDHSTDHMQGTLAYLAPEIVFLKEKNTGSYGKAVDIWALGLSTFATHTGQQIRWTYVGPHGAQATKMVTKQGYEAYQRRISQSLESTQDHDAASFLHLITRMTQFEAHRRASASMARDTATELREGRKGKIVLKSTKKRRREA